MDESCEKLKQDNKELKIRIEIKNRELVKNEELKRGNIYENEKVEKVLNELKAQRENRMVEIERTTQSLSKIKDELKKEREENDKEVKAKL